MEERKRERLERLQVIIGRASNPVGARNVIAFLFPKAEEVLKTYVSFHTTSDRSRRKERRISDKAYTQSYFGLDPQRVMWSKKEVDRIVEADNPEEILLDVTKKIEAMPVYDRPRLREVLLDAISVSFDVARPLKATWLLGFANVSPYFIKNRDESSDFFGVDNFQRLRWILKGGGDTLDERGRSDCFKFAVSRADDLSLLCDFVRTYTTDRHPGARGDESQQTREYFGEGGDELREELLHCVQVLAGTGQLWRQADPSRLIWFWWSCGRESEVKEFTARGMQDIDSLRVLLEIPLSLVRSSAGNYRHVGKFWSSVVDLDALKIKALRLSENGDASEADRRRVAEFIEALKRGKEE